MRGYRTRTLAAVWTVCSSLGGSSSSITLVTIVLVSAREM